MNFNARVIVRAALATIAVTSLSACVSPAARIPCDGNLEPINTPANNLMPSDKRSQSLTSKVSP